MKTKHEMKTSSKKIEREGKLGKKKDKLNIELFVMLSLPS